MFQIVLLVCLHCPHDLNDGMERKQQSAKVITPEMILRKIKPGMSCEEAEARMGATHYMLSRVFFKRWMIISYRSHLIPDHSIRVTYDFDRARGGEYTVRDCSLERKSWMGPIPRCWPWFKIPERLVKASPKAKRESQESKK